MISSYLLGALRHSFFYGTTWAILFPLMVQLQSPQETLSMLFFSYSKFALGYISFYCFRVTANKFTLWLGESKVMYLYTAVLFQTLVSYWCKSSSRQKGQRTQCENVCLCFGSQVLAWPKCLTGFPKRSNMEL